MKVDVKYKNKLIKLIHEHEYNYILLRDCARFMGVYGNVNQANDMEKLHHHIKLLYEEGILNSSSENLGFMVVLSGDTITNLGARYTLTAYGHEVAEINDKQWWKRLGNRIFDFSGNIIQITLTAIITAIVTYYFAKYIGAC